ncbi:MAG: GDP-mannose 4,6-dehydratase, partial [Muribaculaceae bacterium]|nr:GDP-mannose 4,6-dehydratase [Muribaculaceae bacterium]
PYSASKASSDHLVRAFHDTYGLPTVISNCSNNYGPNQFPEKLIPLFIDNIRLGRPLPVYGQGLNVRDWLYVEDHARALDTIFHHAPDGSTYCIGGDCERRNIDLVHQLIAVADRVLGNPPGHSLRLITHVADRAGHDLRYAIDSTRLQSDLGWRPQVDFATGLERTVRWYLANRPWLDRIATGAYRQQ